MSTVKAFLIRLQTMYGQPDSDDPAAFMAEYAKLLKGFTSKELELGCDNVLKSNRFKTWPTVGECVKACTEVSEIERGKIPRHFDIKHPEWSPARVALADKLIVCDLGRTAADEGWILALWDFARESQRLPHDDETWQLWQRSKKFDDAYAQCCRNEAGPLSAALKRLGDSMLERRNQKAELVYGVTK